MQSWRQFVRILNPLFLLLYASRLLQLLTITLWIDLKILLLIRRLLVLLDDVN
jgi:hypothetical protein